MIRMKEPEKILEAKDICKAYGKNMVLNQVNLTIKAGEIYGLVGENGAGKSSLMKVITGLTKPTSGEISLFGKKNLEDERNKIGCLIENPALYMDMTARQNLEIQRTQRGIPGKSSIDEVLEIMDLKDAGNKRVKAFSLGMKQRLGIAIALLGRPQLLILDEPINGLDPTKIIYVREVLKNMNEEDGTTILISSHILPELHQLATVYGFIHHGKMLQQITDKELDEKSAWMESVSGESPSTFRIRTKMCSPTWNRSLASPSQSKDRSLARMEVSTPKISARTTFSATAMTLACTIRSSWILVCPEES